MHENILSYSSSLVPFVMNDDPTRIQMASNQMIQSLTLLQPELPFVQTGNEQLFSGMFSIISKKSGTILEKTFFTLMVEYDDGEIEIFNTNWRTKVFYEIGSRFEENSLLAADISLKYDNIVFGKNLLTFVMPWYGYNYEDAIVINERLIKDKNFNLTSIHSDTIDIHLHQNDILLSLSDDKDEYKPLPKIGEFIKKNQPYLIKKILDYGNLETIFQEPEKKYFDKDVYIYDIKIFPNNWNKTVSEYDLFIRNYIKNVNDYLKTFLDKYKNKLTKNDLLNYIYHNRLDIGKYVNSKNNIGSFKDKKESFNGVIIRISYLYLLDTMLGDKLSNRHGNKGIISKIVPDNEMPRLEDGRTADIIINPLGIISRMNIGQLFELVMGNIVYESKKIMMNFFEEKKYSKIKDFIIKLISILDNTNNNWYLEQTKMNLDIVFSEEDVQTIENIINNFYILQPPFESSRPDQIKEAMSFVGVKDEYPVFDPISDRYIKNEDGNHEGITVGYMYWEKLRHIVIEKYSARSISGYSNKYMQPLGGRRNKGGQRFGEMETWCLAAYDCLNNLDEMLSTKSDNISKKYSYINDTLNDIYILDKKLLDENNETETVRLLKSYLNILGLDLNQKEM